MRQLKGWLKNMEDTRNSKPGTWISLTRPFPEKLIYRD